MTAAAFDAFSERFRSRLDADTRVLALIALGSTARPERRDAYSDHDFWVIVAPGARAAFLEDASWLPDTANLVAAIRTGARYLVVLYDSGHVMEVGVFEPDELSEGKLSAYRVLFDRQGIEARLAGMAARSPAPPSTPDEASECALMFVTLLTGAARAARGEHLSADKYVRRFALDFLIGLLVRNKPLARPELIDPLDPWRRFDEIDPAAAADILAATRLPTAEAALRLLDIAERELRGVLPEYPARVAAVVRAALQRLAGNFESGVALDRPEE